MPARIRRINHNEKTREKIKTAYLVNALQGCVDGTRDLSPSQIKAAEILLSKTLPALQSSDIRIDAEPARTYEEIKTDLVEQHGKHLANLLLGEITQGQYNQILLESKIMDKADKVDLNVESVEMDVSSPHTLALDSPDPGATKHQ